MEKRPNPKTLLQYAQDDHREVRLLNMGQLMQRQFERVRSFVRLLGDIHVLAGPYKPLLYGAGLVGLVVSLTDGLVTALAVNFVMIVTKSESSEFSFLSLYRHWLPANLTPEVIALIALIVAGLLRIVARGAAQSFYAVAAMRIVTYARLALLDKVLAARFSYLDRVQTGGIREIVSNNVQSLVRSFQNLMKLNAAAITIVIFLGILVSLSMKMSLVLGIILSAFLPVKFAFGRKIHRLSAAWVSARLEFFQHLNELLNGIRQVKLQNRQERFRSMTARLSREVERNQLSSVLIVNWEPLIIQVFLLATVGFLLYFSSGEYSISALLAYLLVVYRLVGPITEASQCFNALLDGLPRVRNVTALYRLSECDLEDVSGKRVPLASVSSIRFEHVSFGYKQRKPLLKNINFEARKGEFIGIIGPSGSGKSSFVHLMLKMYSPSAGRILFGQHKLSELHPETVRDMVGLVSQDVHLFDLSIEDLIRGDSKDLTKDDVIAAASTARINDFIQTLPHGYATKIGERGAVLSGGQRQRLFIAQILARQTPVVIFDEATSALDGKTEEGVLRDLQKFCADKILIVITHRLDAVRDADCIHVLVEGEFVESGAWDDLLARQGAFWTLYNRTLDETRASTGMVQDTAF